MNTIYVVSLEPIETRYTIDWYDHLPNVLSKYVSENGLPYRVYNIGGFGKKLAETPTDGAFLNFSESNIWKNDQMNFIADLFRRGEIKAGDKFLFTDAWNSGIIQLRYMSSLLEIPVEIHSIWHAGSYDPWDFLGRKFNKSWSYDFERSIFYACDKNYFATEFHADIFKREMCIAEKNFTARGLVCGLPFEYLKDKIKYDGRKKRDLILFPHRISPEKQPEIFSDLAIRLPEYEFVFCQEKSLTKSEYYELLLDAKMVFSANLQETLGISVYEGYLANAFPLVPDRLSYVEIWDQSFKYPSNWVESFDSYFDKNKLLIDRIKFLMTKYDSLEVFNENTSARLDRYFNSKILVQSIFNG